MRVRCAFEVYDCVHAIAHTHTRIQWEGFSPGGAVESRPACRPGGEVEGWRVAEGSAMTKIGAERGYRNEEYEEEVRDMLVVFRDSETVRTLTPLW